jgi:Na+-translocating ferredoxin:NAD+ oxidoreductase RnfG subunit
MTTTRHNLIALALFALSATAFAQSATTTTPDTKVGVTPSEAKEAMDKAVPRSDTATVTRTDESAADKARRAANATADAVTPGTRRDTNTASGSSASTTGAGTGMSSSGSHTTRAARADRN